MIFLTALALVIAIFLIVIHLDRWIDSVRAERKRGRFTPARVSLPVSQWIRNRELENAAVEAMRRAMEAAGQRA